MISYVSLTKEDILSMQSGCALLDTMFHLPGSSSRACNMPVVFRYLPHQDAVQTTFFIDEDTKPVSLTLMLKDYGEKWRLFVSKTFSVKTPHGTLIAYDKDDAEYPGIMVELEPTYNPDDQNVALAMIEYIPGGEGIADYDPRHPNEVMRQNLEVPPERREKSENFPDQEQVTAGFVTRSWPDEIHQIDRHYRTFHYGYKRPWQTREELETEERRAFNRFCGVEYRYGKQAPQTKQARDAWEQAKRNLALVTD